MINFEFNNTTYRIRKRDSINNLLAREELLKLPLSAWQEMLEMKDGICLDYVLSKILKAKIEYFDLSENVNMFTLKGINYWFDKTTRVSLAHMVNCSSEKVTFLLGDEELVISKELATKFLQELETYAAKCFLTTSKHLKNINLLKTVEDLLNYDYTKGYPEKVIINE